MSLRGQLRAARRKTGPNLADSRLFARSRKPSVAVRNLQNGASYWHLTLHKPLPIINIAG